MTKQFKWQIILFFALIATLFLGTQSAMATSGVVPLPSGLNAGDSVTGMGTLVPNLEIHNSAGNDVVLVREEMSPIAFGANKNGGVNILNACLFDGWGFADLGSSDPNLTPQQLSESKQHSYTFTFTPGMTVSEFAVSAADWGDLLPYGGNADGIYALRLIAYNAAGDIVDTDELAFHSTGTNKNNRITDEFGSMSIAGDACQPNGDQPGNHTYKVEGTGIVRVEMRFKDRQSMDPNMALHNPLYFVPENSNNPPVAGDNHVSTALNTLIGIPVLTDDSDPDGDAISITQYDTTSAHGGTVNCTEVCTYTPSFGFTGTDTFSYTICDSAGLCDSATVTIDIVNPVGETGCSRTQGYWKTYSEIGPAPYDETWGQLPQGVNTIFYLSGQSYYTVMDAAPKGNAYYQLAPQFIAVEMNIRSGASIPNEVLAAWQQSQALFKTYTPNDVKSSKDLKATFIALAGVLDAYNNGLSGPGHCQ